MKWMGIIDSTGIYKLILYDGKSSVSENYLSVCLSKFLTARLSQRGTLADI